VYGWKNISSFSEKNRIFFEKNRAFFKKNRAFFKKVLVFYELDCLLIPI